MGTLVRNWLIAAFTIRVLMAISKDMSPKRGVFFKTGSLLSNKLQISIFDSSKEINLSLEYTGQQSKECNVNSVSILQVQRCFS